MADADEATREYMQQEATQEFIDVNSQESLFVLVSGVSPAERDHVIHEGNEPAIGNRNTMGVSAEIAQRLIGPTERGLAVDHPSWRVKLADQTSEQPGLGQTAKRAVELELSGSVGFLEGFEEFAAEDLAEDALRKKEAGITVPHLASHILGRMAAVLSDDWQQIYRHPVYFAETFIDPGRFRGTCYRAANWQLLGRTTGRGKNDQTNRPNRPIKEVLGLPLTPRFRDYLSRI